jgi:hypothetical protein
MIMTIYTIVYRSVPVFSGSVARYLSEIDSILATARRRNAEVSITGAMLFNEDWFVQLLEGKEADVRGTFDRIAADTRHEDVQVLFSSTTSARSFPKWSMAFVGDAAAIRKRFGKSPLAKTDATMRGDDVVDFVVALAREKSR